MSEVGRLAVWTALLAGVGTVIVGLGGVGRGGQATGRSPARWLLGVAAGSCALATTMLALALLRRDFSWTYVASVSRRDASGPYRLAGLWGGMAGSLLWFSTLVGLVGWIAAGRGDAARTRAVLAAVPGGLLAAFAGLILAFADPFDRLDTPVLDGAGLTPILEHPAMLYHPPLLYLGLATLVAPFALVVASLLAEPAPEDPTGLGSSGAGSAHLWQARRWLLVPWTLLAVGMVAGAHWAYVELGWGGYWAWDPVENTALLPWLAATLALHVSLPTRSLRDTSEPAPELRAGTRSSGASWARGFAAFVCLTFLLALTGTMLTRSGAVPSVHAFAEDRAIGRGLAAVVGVAAAGIALLFWRSRDEPAPEVRAGTRSSGAGSILIAGHVAVVGSVLAITLVGTMAPLASDLTGGDGLAIEGRYFAGFSGPLATVGLALVALVPLARRSSSEIETEKPAMAALLSQFRWRVAPPAVGTAVGVGALWAGGGELDAPRLILGAAAGAALVGALAGGIQAVRAGRRVLGGIDAADSGNGSGSRSPRHVTPHVAHAGLGILLLGMAGTATGATETLPVQPGDTVEVLGQTIRYDGVSVVPADATAAPGGQTAGDAAAADATAGEPAEGDSVVADVRVAGRSLEPALVAYPERNILLAETSTVSTPLRDIQVALRDAQDDGTALLQIGVHPLQVLVWWGALLIVAAGIVSLVRFGVPMLDSPIGGGRRMGPQEDQRQGERPHVRDRTDASRSAGLPGPTRVG